MTEFMKKIVENQDGAYLTTPEEEFIEEIFKMENIKKGALSLGMTELMINEKKALALISQLKVARLKSTGSEKILCTWEEDFGPKYFFISERKSKADSKFSFGIQLNGILYPYQGKKMEEIFLLAAVTATTGEVIDDEANTLKDFKVMLDQVIEHEKMLTIYEATFLRMANRVQKSKHANINITSADDLSVVSLKGLKVREVVLGEAEDFAFLGGQEERNFLKTGVFHLRNDLSDFEKALIPTIPDWYVMPEEVGRTAKLIKNIPNMRNVAFKGESSTGKTEASRALAAALGIPYVSFTCGENMDEYDLIGQPTPYTFIDGNGEEKTEIRFVETDLIKAIRNGWLVEIQEPNVARQQGVFVKLNGLMDRDGKITLSNGEVVERHPNSVIVMTMNEGYVSTRPMNQAVLRRLGTIMKFELPSVSTLTERLRLLTGVENQRILNLVVESGQKIVSLLKENGLDDGTCGTADLRDWLNIAKVEGSLLEAAEISVVQKATSDEDTKEAIRMYLESKVTYEDEDAMAEIAG